MAPSSPAPEATTPAPPVLLRRLEYEDLRLLIEGSGGEYRASVVESPAGESSAPETIRWSSPAARLDKERDVRRTGASLFDAFVTGQIRDLYRASIALSKERGRGLRLKLLIDSLELVGAPWELLYDGQNGCYVGLSSRTPIVRHPKLPQPVEPLRVDPPLRILGVIANPHEPDLPSLDVATERKLIDSALAQVKEAGLVEVTWLDGGTWEALQQAMWQRWHVFHFCGHGDYDAEAGEGYLLLENANGRAHRLAATQLGLLLREQGDVRLAVLNACKGAVGDTRASSSSVAGALMRAGMSGVVAMQNPISDPAALTFARVTYLAIASGLPLEAAIGSARVAMTLEHATPIEWWTPVLHMRSSDGALFNVASSPAASRPAIRGMEYLGPDLDRRLEQTLARRRWRSRLLYSWMLAPIPFLGFLMAAPVSTDLVSANIEASGVTFVLSSERELFAELPRLQSFSASGFGQLALPGSAFPVRPESEEAQVVAVAADGASWISLQPWMLPGGSQVTWDHPRGARTGEYALSVLASAERRFQVGLVNRITLSRFRSAPELHDYGGNSAMEIVTSNTSLNLVLQFLQPARISVPRLVVDSIQMVRQGFNDQGPLAESTILRGQVHFDGRDIAVDSTHLSLGGLHEADMSKVRLIDDGIAFTLTGSVKRIMVGGKALAFPSRLEWLVRERPSHLWLAALAYVLILVAAVMSWRVRLSAAIAFVLGLAAGASPLEAVIAQTRPSGNTAKCRPPSSIAPDEALQLAVKLKTYTEGEFFQDGTGIVIGDRGGTLYIATAAHVVQDAGQPVDSIHAYFYTDCFKPVTAKVCSVIDAKRGLDLAVLCVRAAAGARPPSLSRLGNVRRLSARTPVYPVGCPGGECWGVGQPDKVLVADPDQPRILFATFFVAPGHSGGPLFNEWWEVVGMLTKLGQPLSEAISIDSVLSAACSTPCREQEKTLQSPFVPRGGYPLSLGLNGLFVAADADPGGRFPAGRANVMYRIDPLLELHAGSLRLTPENLSATGAMIGFGLNIPSKGRVWLNPFLEGGFGHVEGRFDAGGHYVDQNGTNVYVPLWRQVEDDVLGYGAGMSLMALVAPHTIVEILIGHWSFNRPTNAPGMPDIVWGAGLRLGM